LEQLQRVFLAITQQALGNSGSPPGFELLFFFLDEVRHFAAKAQLSRDLLASLLSEPWLPREALLDRISRKLVALPPSVDQGGSETKAFDRYLDQCHNLQRV
jgi:hypothetical protein